MSKTRDEDFIEEELSEENLEESIWLNKDFDSNAYYSVYVTCNSLDEARKIADELITTRVAACVNIIPRIVSIYEWRDRIQEENESVMFIKTRGEKMKDVITVVKKLHSYDVPAILALPLKAGYLPYLNWINEQTSPKEESNRKLSEE